MTRITQGSAIRDFITKSWIQQESLDVMCGEKDIRCAAFLASIIVTLKNCLPPFFVLFGVPTAWSWASSTMPGTRRIELGSNHGSTALVRAKDMAITSLAHFLDFGWIAFKFLITECTSQDRLFNHQSFVGTATRAIIGLPWFDSRDNSLKFLSTSFTDHNPAFIFGMALSGTTNMASTSGGSTTCKPFPAIVADKNYSRQLSCAFLSAKPLIFGPGMKLLVTSLTSLCNC